MAKTNKLTGPEQVAEYIKDCAHPLKSTLILLRDLILGANPNLTEHIKWNAPSFCFNGDDRITFNLHKTDCVMLIFHRGAKIKDSKTKGRLFNDESQQLEWLADDRAVFKVYSQQQAQERSEALKKLVIKWIEKSSDQEF